MTALHLNYKDLFRACRLGFSAKKIWMQFLGLVIGGAGYTLLTYAAYALSGIPLFAVWERFSLVPFLDPSLISPYANAIIIEWWSWLIWAIGILWFLAVSMVTATATAKVTFEQLRGDDFFEAKEAFRYALRRLDAVLAAPLMPLLFAVLLIVLGLILSLLGAIPIVGELLVGLFAVPAFGAALFIVYLLAILVFALVLAPAIAGTTKNDAFDSLFEVFSCVNEQSWRLVVYTFVLSILSILCGTVLGWFSLQAARLGSSVLHVLMGEKLSTILSGGWFYLRLSLPSWCPLYNLIGPFGALTGSELAAEGISLNIAALLLGIAAYVVFLFVVAYSGSTWSSGITVMFAVLTKKKDDKNLLQEPEEEDALFREPTPNSDSR